MYICWKIWRVLFSSVYCSLFRQKGAFSKRFRLCLVKSFQDEVHRRGTERLHARNNRSQERSGSSLLWKGTIKKYESQSERASVWPFFPPSFPASLRVRLRCWTSSFFPSVVVWETWHRRTTLFWPDSSNKQWDESLVEPEEPAYGSTTTTYYREAAQVKVGREVLRPATRIATRKYKVREVAWIECTLK